jgi:hypothetical protein
MQDLQPRLGRSHPSPLGRALHALHATAIHRHILGHGHRIPERSHILCNDLHTIIATSQTEEHPLVSLTTKEGDASPPLRGPPPVSTR